MRMEERRDSSAGTGAQSHRADTAPAWGPQRAASRTRVPVGDTAENRRLGDTCLGAESPEPYPTCALASAGGLRLYSDHSSSLLLQFHLASSVPLRNHLLSGRDNIYIPHKGSWAKFCFWLHVSIPPTTSSAAAMSNRAGFVLLRLHCHTSYFSSSKSPFAVSHARYKALLAKSRRGIC